MSARKKLEKVVIKIKEKKEKLAAFINDLERNKINVSMDLNEKDSQGTKAEHSDNFWTDTTLLITDDAKTAKKARQAGAAVLIYLKNGSLSQEFDSFRYFIEGFEDANAHYAQRIYEREKKLPWTIFQTENLTVREAAIEDLDAIYSLYEDKNAICFLEDLNANKEEEKAYFQNYIDTVYGILEYGTWLITLTDTHEIIGRVGLTGPDEEEALELGFLISSKFWHKGYAYEVLSHIPDYVKENLSYRKLFIVTDKENIAAQSLCRKLDYQFTEEVIRSGKEMMRFVLEIAD